MSRFNSTWFTVRGRAEHDPEIHGLCTRCNSRLLPQAVGTANHLVDGAEAETGHDLAQFFRNIQHEVHDVFRFTPEAFPQRLVLSGNAERAGVFIADTHHHAPQTDQSCRRETEFLRAEQGGDRDVAAAHQLAVCLQNDPVAQAVFQQCAVRFGEPQFPRKSRVMDGRERGGAGAAVVSGDQDHLSTGLGHAGSDRSHTGL